jgi:hypothetical protein
MQEALGFIPAPQKQQKFNTYVFYWEWIGGVKRETESQAW